MSGRAFSNASVRVRMYLVAANRRGGRDVAKKTEIFLHSREADDFRVNTDAELLFETVRARRRPDVNDFACSVFNKM